MCISPKPLKNPNKGLQFIRGDPRYLKDRLSTFMFIPCGVCPECIQRKQLDLVQRVLMESTKNEVFFITMTYNNESLPFIEVNNFDISYADHQDVVRMFKRLKKRKLLYPFSYFGVSELGSKRGRPHFHLLLFFSKEYFKDYNDCISYQTYLKSVLLSNWQRNISSTRKPTYIDLCTYRELFINNKWRRNFDVQYCCPTSSTNGVCDVAFYCLKYMLKPSDRETRLQQALHLNLSPTDYENVWSIVRTRSFYSTGFGLNPQKSGKEKIQDIIPDPEIINYLKECVRRSISNRMPFPCFYSPLTGQSFPLARYYQSREDILSLSDAYEFYYINNPDLSDPYYDRESLVYSELICKLQKHEKHIRDLHFSNDDYLSELCQ